MKLRLVFYAFLYLLFSINLPLTLSAQTPSNFLQAKFSFTDGSLEDESSNGIGGTGVDLTPVTGIENQPNSAFDFNSTSSYIDCGTDNRNISNQVTISAWIKMTSTSIDRQVIVSKYHFEDDGGYFLSVINGSASLGGRDGSGTFFEITSEELKVNDGSWHHIAGVIDRNNFKLYVDCEQINELTTSTSDPQYAIPDPLTIGRLSVGTGEGELRFFQGSIDHVELYNVPLTAAQLSEISITNCSPSEPEVGKSIIKTFFGFSLNSIAPRATVEMPNGDVLIAGERQIAGFTNNNFLVAQYSKKGEFRRAKWINFSGMKTPTSMIATSDGGYAIIGTSKGVIYGEEDVVLLKLDAALDIQWAKAYGGVRDDRGFSLTETEDGNLFLVGSTRSLAVTKQTAFVIKTNAQGETIWYRTFFGQVAEEFYSIQAIDESTFAMFGFSESYGSGGKDFMVVKMDDEANFISMDVYGNEADEFASMIQLTDDDGFILYGHSLSSDLGGFDGLVMKIDAAGEVVWANTFGGVGNDYASNILLDQEENIYLSGYTESSGAGLQDLFLLKLAPDGELLEARTYGTSENENLLFGSNNALLEFEDGRILMVGGTEKDGEKGLLFANLSTSRTDVCLGQDWPLSYIAADPVLGLTTSGRAFSDGQFADLLTTTADYVLTEEALTSDLCPVDLIISANSTECSYQASNEVQTSGPLAINTPTTYKAGNRITLLPGFQVTAGNEFLATIDDCSLNNTRQILPPSEETSIVEELPASITPIKEHQTLKVFPNPISSFLSVQLNLEKATNASLWIQNASGRVIHKQFTNQKLESGQSSREIDLSHLPTGMYFLRFWSEEETYVEKLLKVD